jgi:AcrR family transcriptional regulator
VPKSAKKPYHHGDLREALVAAAESALGEMPLETVSLRDIARRAGVTHAAPKHHFATLGDLFAEVAARGYERFVATLAAAANKNIDQSPPARLQAMFPAYLDFAIANPAAYGLMFGKRNGVSSTPHLAQASQAAWAQLEQHVAAVATSQHAVQGALLVWSFCHGAAMLILNRNLPFHLDSNRAMAENTRAIIAMLQAQK